MSALTILVVEDNPGTRLAINTCLKMSDYSVLTAADGREALDRVNVQRPDLIVTDIIMPRMNGYELVQSIRQQPALRLIPVIFLTVQNKVEEQIRGYQSGADLYLPKPFDLKELLAAVRNRLERVQVLQEAWLTSRRSTAVLPKNPELPPYITQREREALALVAQGLSNAEIGTKLHLFSRMPPTGNTFPRRVISPVIATSFRTNRPEAREAISVAIASA